MNKCYQIIWNVLTNTWVAVAENVKARGKPASGVTNGVTTTSLDSDSFIKNAKIVALKPIVFFVALAFSAVVIAAPPVTELPVGGNVVAGQAAISLSGNTLNIIQGTSRAAVNWNTFNVGSAASVNFIQPSSSSVILNRVLDSNPSQIYGHINANGQVFLTNSSGIYFAPGASVNVGGLVATTHSITDADFMAGKNSFTRNGATGSVINDGNLTTDIGGYIALLAPEVRNNGVIIAKIGTVALAAGEAFELQFDGNNTLSSLRVEPSTINALVENGNAVQAPGGLIILSALAVDHIQGSVVNSGSLSASSLTAKGGRILLEGDDITLKAGSTIDATGVTGGGEVLVGGDWQGSGSLHQATTVTMEQGATIDASATQNGDGGKVVLWSDVHNASSVTIVDGRISATGAGSGTGGKIETSGHQLGVGGSVNSGQGGSWLLDPVDITITSTGGSVPGAGGTYSTAGNVQASTIVSALDAGNNVTIDTTGGSGGNGDITVSSAVSATNSTTASLTLNAYRDVLVNSSLTVNGGINLLAGRNVALNANLTDGGTGNAGILIKATGNITSTNSLTFQTNNDALTFWSNATSSGSGYIAMGNSNVFNTANGLTNQSSGGGAITFGGGSNPGSDYATAASGSGQAGLRFGPLGTGTSNTLMYSGGGNISLYGKTNDNQMGIVLSQGGTFNAGNGSLTLNGLGAGLSHGIELGAWANISNPVNFTASSINITGVASNASGYHGILFNGVGQNNSLTTTGSGGITLNGSTKYTGGYGVTAGSNWSMTSAGNIAVTSLVVAGGTTNLGINFSVATATASAITLTATGGDITTGGAITVGGPISITGGNVALNGSLTSTGTGDINIIGNTNSNNGIVSNSAGTINKTGGGDSTLTVRSNGRVNLNAAITNTSASGKLNVVLWSDYGNNNLYGVSLPSITTKGGAVWVGGSSTPNGSTTWNGLTVGDGPSVGSASGNNNPIDWTGLLTTAGGNVTIWSGTGYNSNTLATSGSAGINAGSGNVNIYARAFSFSGALPITTTGAVTIAPDTSGGSFGTGVYTSWFNFTGATLGGLTLGAAGNTAALTVDSAQSVAGPISIIGGDVALNASLTSTAAGAAITLQATGNISTANSAKTISTNNGNITIAADSDANASGLLDLDYTTLSAGSGNVVVRGETMSWNVGVGISPTITSTTGSFTFESSAAAFGQAVDTGWFIFPSTLSSLTIGKTTNTQDVYVGTNALTVAGPISVYGGNIAVNANLTSTANGAGILLKGSGNITQAASTTTQTNGGDITYWSNSTDAGGYIYINDGATIDSRTNADRTASNTSAASGGGAITLGGGSTSTSLSDGTVVPTGYALQNATSGSLLAGILLGTYVGGNKNENIKLYSGGGNVVLRGKSTTGFWTNYIESNGILSYEGLTLDAGTTGGITLDGQASTGQYATGLYFGYHMGVFANTLFRTANGNISLTGSASGGTNNRGIVAYSDATYNITMEATGTGSVTLAGSGATQDTILQGGNILAASGAITLNDTGAGPLNTSSGGGVTTIGYKSGSDVTSSTSNVVITDDSFSLASGAGLQVNSTGTLTVQPYGNNFSSTLNWPMTDFAVAAGLTGLTLGKDIGSTAHTDTITIGTAQTIAGPISVYAGTININAPLTASGDITLVSSGSTSDLLVNASITQNANATSNLLLKSARHILLASGATISANNAAMNTQIWADSDKSGDGIIQLANSSISTNGGWLKFGNNQTATINGSTFLVGGDVFFNSGSAQTLSTGGGALDIYGETIISNNAGLTINSGGGDVGFHGVLNSGNQYAFISQTSGGSWTAAEVAAKNGTAGGSAVNNSYLVTITSRLENSIAGLTAGYVGAWIGAWRASPTTSFAWTWVDGPEAGTLFFTQNSSNGGGTTTPGYYSNYGTNEPNGTLAGNESVGQFFGSAGQWNDLTPTTAYGGTGQYAVLGYVRETNLAASALTINAGSGHVTIDGGVGGSKALASLAVTAASTTVNGTALMTTGAQTYNNALTVNSTGTLNVAGTALSITNANQALSLTAAGDVTLASGMNVTVDGSIGITSGGNLTDNANLTSTATNSPILLKAAGLIKDAASTTFQTNGGDITFWSNSADGATGGIYLLDSTTVDSRTAADRSAANISTASGGGAITLGGGSGSTALASGTVVPTGYAQNFSSGGSLTGIMLGTYGGGHNGNVKLYSGGGNIVMNGKASGVDASPLTIGIQTYAGLTVDAGTTGNITVAGIGDVGAGNTTSEGDGLDIDAWRVAGLSPTLFKTSNGNINISGTGQNAGGSQKDVGISLVSYGANDAITIEATGSGSVTLTGTAAAANGAANSQAIRSSTANILAASGLISILSNSAGATYYSYSGTTTIGRLAASDVLTSSSNINFSADTFTLTGATNFATSGTLTVQSYGNSFTSALSWPLSNVSLSGDVSGLTIGKTANTSDITIGSATSIAGPIDVYGGTINVNASLTSAAASGTGISLNGSQIVQAAGTTVATGGADIAYLVTNAPFTAGVDYGITLNGSSGSAVAINAHGGNVNLSAAYAASGTASATNGDRAIRVSYANITTSGSGAISITGDATNDTATGTAWGMQFYNSLVATGSGDINITGTGGKASGNSRGIAVDTSGLSVLSQSGAITLTDKKASGLTGTYRGMYFYPSPTANIYFGADGTTVATSTSNVSLIGDAITFAANSTYMAHANTAGNVVVESDSSTFTSALDMSSLSISGDPSSVTIGKTTNIADITLGGAITAAGPISVYGGNLNVNANLAATAGDVLLNGSGAVTIAATKAVTTSAGDITITGSRFVNNSGASALSAGGTGKHWQVWSSNADPFNTTTGDVRGGLVYDYKQYGATYGSSSVLGSGNGLLYTYTPTLTASLTGTVTKVYDGGTTATLASGNYSVSGAVDSDTIMLNDPTSGSYTSAGSASAIKDVGTGKTVQVTGVTISSVANGSAAVYGYSLTSGTASGSVGAITPKTVTLSGAKTYDGTTTLGAGTVTIGTGVGSETLTYSAATANDANVATAAKYINAITLADGTGGGLASNYQTPTLDNANAAVTINAANLTLAGTRAYDATTTVAGSVLTATGVHGETFTVSGAGDTTNLISKDVQTNQTLASITGLSLGSSSNGGLSSNYNALDVTGSTVSITPKTVGLSASKTYDGTTDLTGAVTIATDITGEALTYTGATANNAHVATTGKYINAISLANGAGGLASNYQLPTLDNTNAPVTITAKTLSASASIGGTLSKSYDATNAATGASVSGSVTGAVAGDTLTLDTSGISLAYNGTHVVGTNAIVATGAATLSISSPTAASVASDYSFSAPTIANASASITAATLTPTITNTGVTKTYDGGTSAPAGFTPTYSFTGFATGDTAANLSNTGATYDSQNVVGATKITVSGLAITGITGTNSSALTDYALSATSKEVAASITPKNLTISGLAAANKTYDANTDVVVSNWGDASTGIGTESLMLNHGTAGFSTAGVANGKTVTATGYSLANGTGGLASNYALSSTIASTTADITKAVLTVTANADAKFVTQSDTAGYNGVSYNGFVGGETSANAGLTGTLAISRSNSVINAAGMYSGVLVPTGLSASNYDISYANGSYTIVPAGQLLVNVLNTSSTYGTAAHYSISSAKYLDGSNVIQTLAAPTVSGNTYTYSDGAGGSAVFTLAPAGAPTSGSGNFKVGNYSLGATNISETSANFSNNLTVVGNLTVNQKALTATASSVSKVYDGTTGMTGITLGLTGEETGDMVTVSGSGAFSQRNVGSSLSYAISNITLGSADAENYYLSGGNSLSGNNGEITLRQLTITAVTDSKMFNGNTSSSKTPTYNGLASGDILDALTQHFDSALVGTRTLSVSAYSLSDGNSGGNYSVTLVTTPGQITSAPTPPPPPSSTPPAVSNMSSNNPAIPPSGGLDLGHIGGDSVTFDGGLGAKDATSTSTGGDSISVILQSMPEGKSLGAIAVNVPKEMATAGSSFNFPLPTQVVEVARNSANSVLVTLVNGESLPIWLKFHQESMNFTATELPADALPIQVLVKIGNQMFILVVSQRNQ